MKTKTFRLQELFETLESLREYCGQGDQHIAWGFDTPEDAWNANPLVEWMGARRQTDRPTFPAKALARSP